MKASGYKNKTGTCYQAGIAALLLSIILFSAGPSKALAEPQTGDSRIRITADSLVASKTQRYATFSGNVKASYSGSTMTSETMHVYYSDKKTSSDKKQSFEKIIATGNVIVKFDGRVATAEQAVYTAGDETIVLSGGSPKITTGSSFITGKSSRSEGATVK